MGPIQLSIVICFALAIVNLLEGVFSVTIDPVPIVDDSPILIGATKKTPEPINEFFPPIPLSYSLPNLKLGVLHPKYHD